MAGQHREMTDPGDKIIPFPARPKAPEEPKYSGYWEEIGGRTYHNPVGPGPHPEIREYNLPTRPRGA
jgi:hypothetical protein